MASSNLPIIDVGPLRQKDCTHLSNNNTTMMISKEEKAVAQKIRSACQQHGFFYVQNHGISSTLIKEMMKSTKNLFDLSSDLKEAISSKNSDLFRGYISTSDGLHTCNSKKKQEVGLDQKESFTVGAEHNPVVPNEEGGKEEMKTTSSVSRSTTTTSPMHGPNQWPNKNDLPTFQSTVMQYWNEQLTLCRVIARGLALSLDLPPTFFEPHLTDPVAQMVLLKYPPPPTSMDKDVCQMKHPGCGEHTDCGFLTILTQDLPGLEVEDPLTKEWKSVEPIGDTFIVNLGDMAARWTNDVYKSTKHRVYNNNDYDRYSIPFFCNCNFDAPVKCIMRSNGSCNDAEDSNDHGWSTSLDKVEKYEPTTAGAYILERLGLMRLVE